jgi:hypothetical protein
MSISRRLMLTAAAIVMSYAAAVSAAASEEQTIDAFSVWHARGHVFKIGENIGMFVGALQGPFFIETPEGPVGAGTIICPGLFKVNLEDGSQTGEGECMITGQKGEQVFAKWTCSGYHLIGCKGEFTLYGGTGRFSGITGGGPIVVRTTIREIAVQANENPDVEATIGIAFWKGLRYELP